MPSNDDELACPHCEERFTLAEACWTVCLTCGHIRESGEDTIHHTRYDRNGDFYCSSGLRVYTREAAEAKRQEVRERDGKGLPDGKTREDLLDYSPKRRARRIAPPHEL